MLRNNLKLTFRRMKRDPFFSILNIAGLTIGVTAFILLTLYVRHELSYDQFHSNGENIYVMASQSQGRNGTNVAERIRISYAQRMKERIPELQNMAMLGSSGDDRLLTVNNEAFYENGVFWGTNEVFEIFDFPLIDGESRLDEPGRAVITQSIAQKYFGDKDPIGRSFEIEGKGKFEVTGLAKDLPTNSHIQFQIIHSGIEMLEEAEKRFSGSGGTTSLNYVLMPENVDLEIVLDKIIQLQVEEWPEHAKPIEVDGELQTPVYFVPYTDIHLKSGFNWTAFPVSDIRYVYLFGSISVLILVIACLNYINLVTAKSIQKFKEIGLRKVLGADKSSIRRQTLIESLLFTLISVLLAFALAERLLPMFNGLIERELTLSYLSMEFVVMVVGITSLVGLTSGLYPAFRLSQFSPVKALTGNKGKERSSVRRGLVFVQFLIAQALIVATVIIQSQLSFLQNKDLGYDREHALFITTHRELGKEVSVFKSEIESIPGVSQVSLSDGVLDYNSITFLPLREIEGFAEDEKGLLVVDVFSTDENFISAMGMEIVSGSDFNKNNEIPLGQSMIINEAFQQQLGWEDPIGRQIDIWGGDRYIVGVMKDFHNESLKAEIKPSAMVYYEQPLGFVNVRINPQNIKATIGTLEEKWDALVPDRPFQFQFYDEKYDAQYQSEIRLGTIFNAFSSIAIAISILGLIGLTAFSVEQRLKEFGIRKVLGAKVKQLIGLLSREFIILILISFAVASPIAYYGLDSWLEEFKYQVEINGLVFVLAISITILASVLAIANQAIKVSKVNPAEILRNE